jgi:hypothetical protein
MTKAEALGAKIGRVVDWPSEAQDELMSALVRIEEKHIGLYRLEEEEELAIEEAVAQANRGELASSDELTDLWARI